MEPKVIVVSGVCGAGKSYWIADNYPLRTKIDMADLLDMRWDQRIHYTVNRIKENLCDWYVVEGIFAPASASLHMLEVLLEKYGISYKVVVVERTFKECAQAILDDHKGGLERCIGRMAMLCKYYEMFQKK